MQVTRATLQAVMSLNVQVSDPKSHTLLRITYNLSSPVLSGHFSFTQHLESAEPPFAFD
jgi:hypothetical protein